MEGRRTSFVDPRAVDSVLRAVDFVEERMGDDIGVEDMARTACFSPFYFSRLFAEATGHSPYDYLMRRRVAAAAEEVVGSERSLTEIALDRGFRVPDSFGRAFRRCFGILPSEARRAGGYPKSIERTRIDRAYVVEMLERPPQRPEAVEMGETLLGGRWGEALEEHDLPQGCLSVVERDGRLRSKRIFVGEPIAFSSEKSGDGGSDSFVPTFRLPPFPGSATRVPAAAYARFRVDGDAARLAAIVEFAYRAWFPASAYARPPAYDLVRQGESGYLTLDLPLEAVSPEHTRA